LNESELIASLTNLHESRWEALKPTDNKSLAHYKKVFSTLWRHTLQVDLVDRRNLLVESGKPTSLVGVTVTPVAFGRVGQNDRIPAVLLTPAASNETVVVLAHETGKSNYLSAGGAPAGLAKGLVERGFSVLLPDLFLTGELADPELAKSRNYAEKPYLTYNNRTDGQERVQDLVTACAFARIHARAHHVTLCGAGRAGLWALLALPAADAAAADGNLLSTASDEALMAQDLFVPGLRNLGAFEGTALLTVPNPLLLHNTGGLFSLGSLRGIYAAVGAGDSFREESGRLSDAELASRIAGLVPRSMR